MALQRSNSKQDYETRLNRAIDFIRNNLDGNITLSQVAENASFSEFHFHRIFSNILGETIHDFIRRLREEKAVTMLLTLPEVAICEVARQCGYSSQSNMAKALKKKYALSPTEIRKNPHSVRRFHSKEKKIIPGYKDKLHEVLKQIRFKKYPERRYAYVRGVVKGGDPSIIRQLWIRISQWAHKNNLYANGAVNIGILLDNPSLTDPQRCQYDAGVTIPDDFRVEEPINEGSIPAGEFMTCEFEGTAQGLEELLQIIYSGWFPSSGFEPGDFPPIVLNRKQSYEKSFGVIKLEINVLLA